MSCLLIRILISTCILSALTLPVFPQNLSVSPTLEENLSSRWKILRSEIQGTEHGLWAYLTIKNVTEEALNNPVLHARYMDSAGRECFSLLFVQQHAYGKEPEKIVQPGEAATFVAAAGSIFPIISPTKVLVSAMPTPKSGQYFTSTSESPVSVPATIMGGGIEGEGTLQISSNITHTPFLALASVEIDPHGVMLRSTILDAVDSSLPPQCRSLIKSLRFLPQVVGDTTAPAQLLVLFARQEELAALPQSHSPQWLWTLPWVQEAAGQLSPTAERLPVLTLLLFEAKDNGLEAKFSTRLQYFPLGSDWCPDLFHWTTDPATGLRARIWN